MPPKHRDVKMSYSSEIPKRRRIPTITFAPLSTESPGLPPAFSNKKNLTKEGRDIVNAKTIDATKRALDLAYGGISGLKEYSETDAFKTNAESIGLSVEQLTHLMKVESETKASSKSEGSVNEPFDPHIANNPSD